MALPLQLPPDGYLRLSFSGPVEVAGVAAQSWDLSSVPRAARSVLGFDRGVLVLARPLTPGLAGVAPTVSFVYDSEGVPTELVLVVTSAAATDEVALDVWCLHSIIGAVSDASKAYFFSPPGSGGGLAPNVQTGTSYTLQASDLGRTVAFTHADEITVSCNAGLPPGFDCYLAQLGTGPVVVSGTATVHNFSGHDRTAGQYAAASLIPVGADTYILQGDTAPAVLTPDLITPLAERYGWWRADAVTLNGSDASGLTELFGVSFNLLQGNPGLQPLWTVNGGPNGVPAIHGDGSQFLETNAGVVVPADTPYWIYVVARGDGVAANCFTAYVRDTYVWTDTGAEDWYAQVGPTSVSAPALNGWRLIRVRVIDDVALAIRLGTAPDVEQTVALPVGSQVVDVVSALASFGGAASWEEMVIVTPQTPAQDALYLSYFADRCGAI
jgi:hypothetical protein